MGVLEEPLSKEAFDKMKFILNCLHEQTVPQPLGSACGLLNLEFWRDWEDYDNAYAEREIFAQHEKDMTDAPLDPGLLEAGARVNEEMGDIAEKIFSMKAEVAKLQEGIAALELDLANKGRESKAIEEQVKVSIIKREEERRRFIPLRVSVGRIEAKERIRLLVLSELASALADLERC